MLTSKSIEVLERNSVLLISLQACRTFRRMILILAGRKEIRQLSILVIFVVLISVLGGTFYENILVPVISTGTNLAFTWDFQLEDFEENGFDIKRAAPLILDTDVKISSPKGSLPTCDESPPGLLGFLQNVGNFSYAEYTVVEGLNVDVKNIDVKRGRYSPKNCQARHKVAVIIPLRGRDRQLQVLLSHIHPVLQRQQLEYTVFIVTQSGNGLFNRAKLMNIGVSESTAYDQYDCFIFHDVDLLVENDECLYWCHEDNPRHLARLIDIFQYEPIHYGLDCQPAKAAFRDLYGFGGVSMLTREQFYAVNGFSNLYWGWGGEDDDMFLRIRHKGYSVVNPYNELCSYRMMKHQHESANAVNPVRHVLLYHCLPRMDYEGYNNLRYKILKIQENDLFINITADIGKPCERLENFMKTSTGNWWTKCISRMPWSSLYLGIK